MTLSSKYRELIASFDDFSEPQLMGYWTEGGSYMLASGAASNDDDEPHDLLAVTAGGKVVPMSPLVSSEFQLEVEAIVAAALQAMIAAETARRTQ